LPFWKKVDHDGYGFCLTLKRHVERGGCEYIVEGSKYEIKRKCTVGGNKEGRNGIGISAAFNLSIHFLSRAQNPYINQSISAF
jgi:hypothetical protein